MPEDLLPAPENQPIQGDLLEQLLVVAAEKAAKREAEDALKKGFVTREQINAALSAFGEGLKTDIVTQIQEAVMPQVTQTVQKAMDAGSRKSTILTPEDELEADPVKYILKKGREQGPESYTDEEKRIIWALTYKGLAKGMKDQAEEDED